MSTPADRARATAALNLAGRLDHLLRTARIYPDGHAGLVHTVRNVIDLAEAVRGEATSIDWSIVQDRVVVGNRVARPSPGLRDAVRELGEFLQSRGIGGLALLPGIDETQLMAAVRLIIGLEADGGPGLAAVARELTAAGVRCFEVLPPRTLHGAEDTGGEADPAVAALRIYLRSMRCIRRMRSHGISPASMVEVERVAQGIVDLWTSSPRRALALAVPRQLLPSDLIHPVHTAVLAVAIGYALGLDDGRLTELAMCALTAPVGFQAPTDPELDLDEEAARAAHEAAEAATPVSSVTQLLGLSTLAPAQQRRLRVALEQHRHFDGGGVPALARWPLPHLFSRIIHLAAHYDALRADSDWADGQSVRGAMRTLQELAGSRHDPSLVAILAEYQAELEVADAGI